MADPMAATFADLLAFRTYSAKNPNDGAANFVKFCAGNFSRSNAQLFQDLLVVFLTRGKRNGFFVEFGASDGITLSNTYLLEKELQWSGILAEPARCWHETLERSRNAIVDRRCVWSRSGDSLEFLETEWAEVSTIAELRDRDFNRKHRQAGATYRVETISLNDLLAAYNAPPIIDYLSIDTEGAECSILEAFAFEKYRIHIITVEHNFCEPERSRILQLLTERGYVRLLDSLSRFDDWYILKSAFATNESPKT
jgi:FkbM family methyltransferase